MPYIDFLGLTIQGVPKHTFWSFIPTLHLWLNIGMWSFSIIQHFILYFISMYIVYQCILDHDLQYPGKKRKRRRTTKIRSVSRWQNMFLNLVNSLTKPGQWSHFVPIATIVLVISNWWERPEISEKFCRKKLTSTFNQFYCFTQPV